MGNTGEKHKEHRGGDRRYVRRKGRLAQGTGRESLRKNTTIKLAKKGGKHMQKNNKKQMRSEEKVKIGKSCWDCQSGFTGGSFRVQKVPKKILERRKGRCILDRRDREVKNHGRRNKGANTSWRRWQVPCENGAEEGNLIWERKKEGL